MTEEIVESIPVEKSSEIQISDGVENSQVAAMPVIPIGTNQIQYGVVVDNSVTDYSKFEVDRPEPPKRRKFGQGSMYEWLFLVLALVSWPITLAMHAVIVAEIRIQSFGMDNKWSANQQGFLIMFPFYLFAIICTYCCYKLDQAVREGEIYAKEKAAYHANMDQYLQVKEAYYKRKAKEIHDD